ncbi:MAG: cellulose biosynthesis cyclic di-GMP-binding regulatory protein BcsB [Mariprofundus sp.]
MSEIAVPKPETPFVTRKVSLGDMGFKKGVMFEGSDVHSRTFFFPAPMDSRITHGTFRLLFRSTSNLHDMANIRVTVNDIPYRQVSLPGDEAMHEMDVLLPASAFKGKLVKVTVHAGLPVTENRCFDERLTDIFLHIMPQTSLTISYQPVEKSIRDAWRLLPQDVTLSLSEGQLSKEQFASTLAVMALLVDNGRKVTITRLPEIGDIVIAPKLTIETLVNQKRLKTDKGNVIADMDKALDHVSNLALVRFPNRTSIVVTDPYDVQPMYMLDEAWQVLGASDHYRVYRPDNLQAHGNLIGTEGDAGYFSLPLSKLGMNTDAKYLKRETSWQTVINPFALPLGTEPDFLNINVVAPVRWENDPTYELYVFLNDVLVKSARLENNGLKQHFTVNLPNEYQKQYNDIRVVVQHDVDGGDCRGVMPHDYVQITPDSALVVKKISGDAPEKFSDLSRYFLAGFDTYLETSYLDNPEQVLHLMARLAADFPLVIDHSRLHFMDAEDVLQPENPFVAVGHFALGENIEAPVRFDRGRVKIESPDGESYFDVNQLSKVTVTEI